MLISIIILCLLVVIELMYAPRVDINKADKSVLLFYNTVRGRGYIVLYKIN